MNGTSSICPCECVVFPQTISNTSEQQSIAYRVGDYSSFREALLRARSGELELVNWRPGAQGDLAVQMIEWWAYLADILTFYNERVANQDYLRTADLPESVSRLIQILGYRPRPGIGATGTLAALMAGIKPLTLPTGFQVQSKPGPGEQPQIFELGASTLVETPDSITAYPPPSPLLLSPDASSVLLQGIVKSIKTGASLLLLKKNWTGADGTYAFVTVASSAQEKDPFGNVNTRVVLTEAIDRLMAENAADYRLLKSSQSAHLWQYPSAPGYVLVDQGNGAGTVHLESITRQIQVGSPILFAGPGSPPISQLASVTSYTEAVFYANPAGSPPDPNTQPNPQQVIPIPILHSAIGFQAAPQQSDWFSSINANTLTSALAQGNQIIDLSAYLQNSQLQLASIVVPNTAQELKPPGFVTGGIMGWATGLDANGINQAIITNNGQPYRIRAYRDTDGSTKFAVVFRPGAMEEVWWYVGIDAATVSQYLTANQATPISLDAYVDTDGTVKFAVVMVLPQNTYWWYWGIDAATVAQNLVTNNAQLTSLSAYVDTDGSVKFAVVMEPNQGQQYWWYWGIDAATVSENLIANNAQLTSIDTYIASDGSVKYAVIMQPGPQESVLGWGVNFQTTTVNYAWQDMGTLIASPSSTYSGGTLSLVTALPASILPMVDQGVLISDVNGNGVAAQATAGVSDPYTLEMSNFSSAFFNLMAPLSVLFDLLPVTRGQTVANEILGSGDATITIGQEFVLQKSPLTYLQSATSTSGFGYTSTLLVWVDGVQWKEVPSFYGQPANAHVFVTREDEQNITHVQFGDGVNGSRLPSGTNNVVAAYRYGSGATSPDAGSLSVILQSWPGLKSIVNPVQVGGGSDPDPANEIKTYAPQSVLTFGRAISADDYEAIAAQAPGVARARSYWVWDTAQQRMMVKVYVGDDANAVASANTALAGAVDPNRPLKVIQATAIPLTLTFTLVVDPDYVATDVVNAVTAALIDPEAGLLGTQVVEIGQSIFQSQMCKACLNVAGALAMHDLNLSGALAQPSPDCADFDFRFDPGEGGFFELPASGLTISPEVANAS
jgi:hypothetical protein